MHLKKKKEKKKKKKKKKKKRQNIELRFLGKKCLKRLELECAKKLYLSCCFSSRISEITCSSGPSGLHKFSLFIMAL